MKLTKDEQKNEAWKPYFAIVKSSAEDRYAKIEQADKERDSKVTLADRERDAIIDPAWEAYQAKCKEIDDQKEEV